MWRGVSSDFHMSDYAKVRCQFEGDYTLSFGVPNLREEKPISLTDTGKIFFLYPLDPFVWMSSLRPFPYAFENAMVNIGKDCLGDYVTVVICPSLNHRIHDLDKNFRFVSSFGVYDFAYFR